LRRREEKNRRNKKEKPYWREWWGGKGTDKKKVSKTLSKEARGAAQRGRGPIGEGKKMDQHSECSSRGKKIKKLHRVAGPIEAEERELSRSPETEKRKI